MEDSVGATTMLLVCWARFSASPEYKLFTAPKPCCSQITPWASTVPSTWVGKYQSAATVLPMRAPGMSSRECPTCTPVTPLVGRVGSSTLAAAGSGSGGAAATTGAPITAAGAALCRWPVNAASAGAATTPSPPGCPPSALSTSATRLSAGAGTGAA